MRAVLPIVAYGVFFAALVAASGVNHPTLALNLVASGIMTVASAGVFIASRRFLLHGVFHYVLVGVAALLAGTASAFSISFAYDALWGPDPLRFGVAENIAMDTAVVLAGWLWTSLVVRLVR